ncbi:MAG: glycosyltransferase family 2 protein [bacterium]|nr:glycosyltransferase family 2 protein [bacterium]
MNSSMPKISVVIPVYNGENTISSCIQAVLQSDFHKYEIIVVDDGSTDNTLKLVRAFPVTLISQSNKGPATARNTGAKKARGEILFFLDADVILQPDALGICANAANDPEINILNGIYHKNPANPSYLTEYKALLEYYWFTVHPLSKNYKGFLGRCAGIRKSVFEEFGGYNTKYTTASVEQEELGMRLAQKYRFHLEPRIQGKHYFPSWSKFISTYFTRTIDWIELFQYKKEFDCILTTKEMALATLSGPLSVILILAAWYYKPFVFTSVFLFAVYTYLHKSIIIYFHSQKGIIFCLKGAMTAVLLSFTVLLASIISYFSIFLRKLYGLRNRFIQKTAAF